VAERPDERQQILDLAAESHASALSIVAGLLGDLERSERYKIKLLGKLATLDRQHAASQAELAYTKSWAHAAGGNLNHMDGVAVELRAHLAEVERERDEAREREERWMMAVTHGPCKCDPPGSGEELCSGGCYLREERDALARELGAAREALVKYGDHLWACGYPPAASGAGSESICICGFAAAIAAGGGEGEG
jgi:hypothetical protein